MELLSLIWKFFCDFTRRELYCIIAGSIVNDITITEKNDLIKITVIDIVTSRHTCNIKITIMFYSKNSHVFSHFYYKI